MPTGQIKGDRRIALYFLQVIPTQNILKVSTFGKESRPLGPRTGTTTLAAKLRTQMASRAFSDTFFETHVLLVPWVIVVAGEAACMAAVKLGIARLGAAALREQGSKVVAVCHLFGVVGMLLTHQIQFGAQ